MKKEFVLLLIMCLVLNLLSFNVNALEPSLSVSCSPSCTTTYPTNTTVSCARIAGDPSSRLTLWRDNHIVMSNSTSPVFDTNVLQAGIYNYSCDITATENYTADISTSNLLTVNQPADHYLVLNASDNIGLGPQFIGDIGTFENDTFFTNASGISNKGHDTFGLIGRSGQLEGALIRWNLTSLPDTLNINNIISARIYLYRYQVNDAWYPPTNNPFWVGSYEIINSNTADDWNEYTMSGSTSPCAVWENFLNASCNNTASYKVNVNPNFFYPYADIQNSSLSWSWDITGIANRSYFSKASKSFSIIFRMSPINTETSYETNGRWSVTSKENGTIITYPQPITVPQLVLVYKSSNEEYNASKGNQTLALAFSPSAAIPLNTTLTANCARVNGDPASLLTLTLNSTTLIYNVSVPFSHIVASGTTSPQSDVRFINASESLTYTCEAASTKTWNYAKTTATVTIINTTVGAECDWAGSRCIVNYTGISYSAYYNATFSNHEDSIFSCVNGTLQLTQQCFLINKICSYANETSASCNIDAYVYPPLPDLSSFSSSFIQFMFIDNYGLNGISLIVNFMVSTVLAVFVNKHLKPEYALRSWLICFGIIAFMCSIYIYPMWFGATIVIVEVLLAAWIFVKFGKGLLGMG